MKTLSEIAKFIEDFVIECEPDRGCGRCDEARECLASLKEQIKKEEKSNVNFMQIRDLTDEEWLKLPKEEILQLYKNCYSMLMNYIKLSGEKIEDVKTVTSTYYSGIVDEVMDLASKKCSKKVNPSVQPDSCCGVYEETHPVKEITDEEIEKEANKISPSRTSPITCAHVLGWMDGAKWIRKQMSHEAI